MTRRKSEEIAGLDVLEFGKLFVSDWLLMTVCSIVAAIASVIYAFSLPNTYRAEALLAPSSSQSYSQANSPLIDQLSAVPGIARFNTLNNGVSEISRTLAILESRAFLGSYIRDHNLAIPLIASMPGNVHGTIEIDPKKYDIETSVWLIENSSGDIDTPSDMQVYNKFAEILFVNHDIDRGFVTVAIEWYDPNQAAEWVNWLIDDLNSHLKRVDQLEAERAISFFQTQAQNTQLVELRSVFYNLIESQMQTLMLADVREQYAVQIIDPAVIAEERIAPNRLLLIMIGTILGVVIAMMIVLSKNLRLKD